MRHSTARPARVISNWWDRWWFQPVPSDLFALLRIVFGFMGLAAVLELMPVSMFWTLDGLTPIPGGGVGVRGTIAALGLGTFGGWAYFTLMVVALTSMIIGYRSRQAVVVAFLGFMLLEAWNHLPLTSAVQVLNVVFFFLTWADCSRSPSVDAWHALRRGTGGLNLAVTGQPVWPLRLIRCQVCIIYLNTGLWKLWSPMWRDGTAVHYSLALNIFHRFPYQLPVSLDWLATAATYTTLAWEIGFAFMMFTRVTRRIALILGVVIHGGLWLALELGPFSWVMIATYLAFLDPHDVKRWMDRIVKPITHSDRVTV